jgi:antitoxin component YwqK of YwqJK toxin-antitoxin module
MRRLSFLLLASLAASGQAGAVLPGSRDGIVQVFSDEGVLLSQTAYREGRKTGRHVSFWPNGRPRVRALYDGDVIEGEYRSWHANGRLADLKHYVAGHEAGLQQAWTDRGELYLNFEVRNGRHYGLINSKPCLPVEGTM